ncbi:MAG: hypothetical protein ACXWVQ_08090 [Methyloceanibacter sp.]
MRFAAEYPNSRLGRDIGPGRIEIDQSPGSDVEHRAKQSQRLIELGAVPHAQIERIEKLPFVVRH